ncbi:RsmB/NOP family class I SAM-dependent RNA methyltransferase [Candidatus Woesearchaeota archaeon]|nr:RsmB/NOP family class I SAM-dependent RNA methyltransferase [Candidatus Woesearchaeota archaeon]
MNKFLERYKELGHDIVPEEVKTVRAIRINTLKIDVQELIDRMSKEGVKLTKIPFLDFGYHVDSPNFSVGAAPEALQGYYYVQEAAAQIPVQVLAPKKTDLVLDMSAAPGGKTTQIAQYMENQGVLVAIDSNSSRLISLRNNIERLGVTNTIIYQKDAQFIFDFGVEFDKILLDAPCSGNFCIDENWFNKRSIEDVKESAKMQKKLIRAAASVLKKGGTLVYSTCSLEPEEDEFVVDWFLKEHPEMKIEETGLKAGEQGLTEALGTKLNPELRLCRRFWPERTKTQGFFIAKLRRIS